MAVFVLNESRQSGKMGDVSFFETLESLLSYVEAIDVRNEEFECYDSDGYLLTLSAEHDYAPVVASSQKDKSHQFELENILNEFLNYLERDGRFGITKSSIDRARSLEDKFSLIPISFLNR